MRRVHAVVRGTVQGVGYRYAMQLAAEQAGVGGWVRNLPDGSVEAEIEGSSEAVDRMLAWMLEGPPSAHVAARDVAERTPVGATGFTVR